MSGIRASFGIERSGFRLDVDLSLPGQGVTALFGHSGRCILCNSGSM